MIFFYSYLVSECHKPSVSGTVLSCPLIEYEIEI